MKIKMYGLSTCPHCKNALKFLKDAGVEYEVIWLDELPEGEKRKSMEYMNSITGSYSVPFCIKGDKWVLGNDREKLEELVK
jgi:glutaredoxin-like protein NrdH